MSNLASADLVRPAIDEVIDSQICNYFKDAPKFILNEALLACKGGKLSRAQRFLKEINSNTDISSEAMAIAAAIEVFQTAMLVHDDIIDHDKMRRGRPSSYTVIGTGQAIVLGDLLITLADGLFNNAILSCKYRNDMLSVWDRMKTEVMNGQILDIIQTKLQLSKLSFEELAQAKENAKKICVMKTASYTTVAPTILGRLYNNITLEVATKDINKLIEEGVKFQLDNDRSGLDKDREQGNISSLMVLEYGDN